MTDHNTSSLSHVYFALQEAVESDVHAARLEPAIAICEKALTELPVSSYHVAKGQSFLDQIEEAAAYLADFYKHACESTSVKSIYVEMTRFEINTDVWDARAFAYDFFGDPNDFGWLCGSKMHSEEAFVLRGLADVREIYRKHDLEDAPPDDERGSYAASMLITLRFQELIRAAVQQARTAGGIPENVPVLAAVHDSDMVMLCYGRTKPRPRKQPARLKHVPAPNDGKERIYSVEDGSDEFGNRLPWDRLFFEPMEENPRLHKFLDQTQPLLDTWKPLKMILHRRKWRCDLMEAGVGRHWGIGWKTYQILAPLLGDSVEFLPVNCEELNPCWIIHPLRYVDLAPTAEHNAMGTANMTRVRKWAFRPEDLAGLLLFGLHQAPRSSSRQAGIGYRSNLCTDACRRAIEANNLYGVVFKELFAYSLSGSVP